jgi:acetyl-CoA acetyltransferase family protein
VVDGIRSAIGKSGWKGMQKRGMLAEASAQDLMAAMLRGLVDRVQKKSPKFNPAEIEDILLGCLSQIGEQGGNIARICGLMADLPDCVAGATINRYCNAGLTAINMAASTIAVGAGDIFIAGGVEMMSHYRMGSDVQVAVDAGYPVFMSKDLEKTRMFVAQGFSAEMVAEKYGFTKEQMDQFGYWSMNKAAQCQRSGYYKPHIVPFTFTKEDGSVVTVDVDETIRTISLDDPKKAMADIRKLEGRFKPTGGTVTAGNSSQIVDGAAATMLMTEEKAAKLGLEPLCRIVSTGIAGDDPYLMLTAPIPAMEKALKRAGLTIDKMDCLEWNEAFASPPMAFAKHFGVALDDPRINPTGGAIAIGHPIGASGVLWFNEMAHWLHRNKKKYGIFALCGGGGVGIATIVEGL